MPAPSFEGSTTTFTSATWTFSARILARKDAEARLLVLNAELEARVLERTSALQAANRDLAASNTELTVFSAAVAHDLRGPLRAINGFARMLIEDNKDQLDANANRQLERIIAAAVRMSALIDALLSLSHVTLTEVKPQTLDLGGIAKAVLDDLGSEDSGRAVEVLIESDMSVEGDPALIRALMQNLLGNAWKFTRGRTPARIEVTKIESTPVDVFSVKDNGAGFDMQHVGVVFVPFQRAHTSSDFEGTGMGLAIVERIVRRHGGKIWANATLGEGATFCFTLKPAP